jgi:hypothetical protein
MKGNVHNTMLYRIRGKGRGWVFSARHFLDLGSRDAIDKALSRMAIDGKIRRLGHGIYDYPKVNPKLGVLSPSIDGVAHEISAKNNSKLKITGAQAANALGLSTQVPARIIYLTDGPPRQLKIGNQLIVLRHASPKTMATAGKRSGTVISALQYLGKGNVSSEMIKKIKAALSEPDRKELSKDIERASEWMRPILNEIIG